MLRTAFSLLSRTSPLAAHIVRESYITLSGRRIEYLKKYIDERLLPSSIVLEHTLRAASREKDHDERIAFVSCLPPATTGLSTCSLYSWLGYSGPVDLFCPVIDPDWFFGMEKMLRGNGTGPRLFDVAGFLSMDRAIEYPSIIIAVGNSDHNLYIFDLLKKLSTFGDLDRVTFLIHDPCLLNLVQKGSDCSDEQLSQMLSHIYGSDFEISESEHHIHRRLSTAGVLGLRYFSRMGIKKYLTNSEAAAQLVAHDLRGTGSVLDKIFHPVFLPMNADSSPMPLPTDKLIVGVYGIPSLDKGLKTVCDAIRIIQAKNQPASLLLAGFDADEFVKSRPELFRGLSVEVVDSPTDTQLVDQMRRCHVAAQLRPHTLGESSGIVPQLLMLDKDVIVTKAGAFIEFGDAVRQISPDASASDLAGEIIRLSREPIPLH